MSLPAKDFPMVDNRNDVHDETSVDDTPRTDAPISEDVPVREDVVVGDDAMYRDEVTRTSESDAWGSASREQADAERERLVAERAARREARLAALAPVPEPEPQLAARPSSTGSTAERVHAEAPTTGTETVTVTQRTTDRFAGSLGLFLLRLVVAAIFGVRGIFHLLNLPATTELIQTTVLPYANILAIVLGAAEVAIAIALVFGVLTRLAGLGAMLVAGGALTFVLWGAGNPFTAGQAGFTGELELLLVAAGLLFLLVGAGGWSVDHGFRSRRAGAN